MSDFLELVELHERSWGAERYPFRPSLQAILDSPVVTFWRPLDKKRGDRYTITLYNDLHEIEQMYTQLLFRSSVQPPIARLARLYVNQERYAVKAVRIQFVPFKEVRRP